MRTLIPNRSVKKINAVFASQTRRPMFDQTPNRRLMTNKLSDSYSQQQVHHQASAERLQRPGGGGPNDESNSMIASYWHHSSDQDAVSHTHSNSTLVNHNMPPSLIEKVHHDGFVYHKLGNVTGSTSHTSGSAFKVRSGRSMI